MTLSVNYSVYGQQVAIQNYSIDSNGQVQLEVNSTDQHYYILKIRHHIDSTFSIPVSMTLGQSGTTQITESLGYYPEEYYEVLEYAIDTPVDTDGDGIDDITEYENMPDQSPLNKAFEVDIEDGLVLVDSFATFKDLSLKKEVVQWSEFLNGKEFVKFLIVDFFTGPQVFFLNTSNHPIHSDFGDEVGVDHLGDHIRKGQIMYHPTSISDNGTLGTFAFNYSNGHPQEFDVVQRTHELLAANMPFLENNLSYFVTVSSEDQYKTDSLLFEDSRVPVLIESDLYAGVNYLALNQAEGFGFFRQMTLEEIPGPKDIVLYESLPNSLPRVGGIMTSVIQTPLSHVNLRAIQNHIPNAFIRDPLLIDSIVELLDHYIYFRIEQDNYYIREASQEEVNAWFEDLRPSEEQIPPLNLNYTSILPLDEVDFNMYDGFGAKCANVATMRSFDFPENTIPDGFGIPFYFYQEFMKYNNFFEEVTLMLNNADFKADRNIRNEELETLRKKIRKAEMPSWMMDELATMHAQFPEGTSVRCRSSSNNEDLAGFNGAGLYDSKTQHPDEGHISKSIKQVFASLWNLRAFEERDFYRISHFSSSMGVLCHPNYSDEKVNGVGISIDPLYNTDHTFYLNSQLGEDLITNPDTKSIPEEILLDTYGDGHVIVQKSNLISADSAVLTDDYLEQMRVFLSVIHKEFAELYHAEDNAVFAMDIEYKVTSADQLIIKQARPWVSYILKEEDGIGDGNASLGLFPNPAKDYVTVQCQACKLAKIRISNILGQVLLEKTTVETNNPNMNVFIPDLPAGMYILTGFDANNEPIDSKQFVKRVN
jgi:hypothetical protein